VDAPSTPAPPAAVSRTRLVVYASGIAAALVMAAIVAFALSGRGETREHRDGAARGFGPGPLDFPDSGCATDVLAPPRLVFDLPTGVLDFGEVRQGVTIEKQVAFRNAGKGLLCIRDVPKTGCGCVKARFVGEKRRFEPGESGAISVTLNTAGRSEKQTKSVTVSSNDPESMLRSFQVTALVTLGLIAPERLDFGRGPAREPATVEVLLKSPLADPDWTVTEVVGGKRPNGTSTAYTFSVEDVADPRFREKRLKVTHPGLEKEGFVQDNVVVKTSHPERPEIVLTAAFQVTPPIVTNLARIALGYSPSGVPAAPVRLHLVATKVPFKVLSVAFEPPGGAPAGRDGSGFLETHGPRESGDGWWVDVKYDGLVRPPGSLEAILVVKTDHPRMPEVRIPVSATVVARR
jgi:hypothetical protein